MKKTIYIVILILILGGVAVFSSIRWGGQLSELATKTENVLVALKWVHQAQFAGNYIAAEKGFYKEQGIKASFIPYSENSKPIDSVVEGRATFGITGADELVLARQKGLPIKAFAVIYKTNPVAAYSLKKSGITKPQDFIGKTVGLERGVNVEYLYSAMMSKLQIDRTKINEVSIGPTAAELLSGETDVSTGYVINEPHHVIAAGQDVNIILMADYGVNMYADVLFATEKTIESKPEIVEKFLRGTLKGWQYATENIEEAVDIVLQYATSSTESHEEYMLKASLPLINDGESPLGWMEKNKWIQVVAILQNQKILKENINAADVYTAQFINKIYNKY